MKLFYMKFFCLLGLIFYLGSCASTQKYDQMLNGWIGKPESALLKSWGSPSARKINTDGSQVITFTQVQTLTVPSEFYLYNPYPLEGDVSVYAPFDGDYAFTPYAQNLGVNQEYVCQTSFFIQNNIITGWKWKGNNCFAD